MDSILEIDNLTKIFSSQAVIKNLSLKIEKGASLLVRGPSGCGKTTLLRCMGFLEKIQEGEIIYDGLITLHAGEHPSLPRPIRKKISMVFQNLYLWNHLSVLDNISIPLKIAGVESELSVNQAFHILKTLNIEKSAKKFPSELSGGQQQRVALARALVHSPSLLLLDEITANLDNDSSKRVFGAVEQVKELGTTLAVVSHSENIPKFLQDDQLVFVDSEWKRNP